jgi:hypothetical protein
MMDSLPNWLVHTVVLAALGFWTALLVNRGIAVFHDGLRLPMGEFVSGSMTRDELLATWKSLSQNFTIWFIPIALGVGIVLGHLLFIPTDYLGVRARTWWAAGLLGGLYGAFMALGLIVVRGSLSALPVNMIDPLYRSLEPLVYGVMVIPAVAAGYQFGWGAGAVTLLVTIAAQIIGLQMPALPANALATAAGLGTLIGFGFRALYKQRQSRRTDRYRAVGVEGKPYPRLLALARRARGADRPCHQYGVICVVSVGWRGGGLRLSRTGGVPRAGHGLRLPANDHHVGIADRGCLRHRLDDGVLCRVSRAPPAAGGCTRRVGYGGGDGVFAPR